MVHVLLIAMFMALFLRDTIDAPLLGGSSHAWAAAASLGLMGLLGLVGHAAIWRLGRRLDRTGQFGVLQRADRAALGLRIGAVVVHAFNVLALGWLDAVRSVAGNIVMVDEVLAVMPALAVFALSWWSMYPLERRLREASLLHDLESGRSARLIPGRGAFVLSAVRHHIAIVLVPVILILTWNEAVEASAAWFRAPALLAVIPLAGVGVVLTMMPLVMRRVWDTAVLSPGPLREQIAAMCRYHRVRVRELLVWRTHGTMVNGAVMGIAWPFRYILLTDALIEHLHPRQVEAVTAHEVGHVRRRHMPWLMAAVLASIVLGTVAFQLLLLEFLGERASQEAVANGAAVASIVLAVVVFGFASRRFEWQADAFAVQHLSASDAAAAGERPMLVTAEAAFAMSSALDAVAHLNHIRRDRFTWRHGSIASRQRRLEALIGRRIDGLKADRDAGIVKVLSGVGFIAAGVMVVLSMMP
jgi:STE24 endopeptidase